MKRVHTFESFLNEAHQHDLVEISPEHVKTDLDIYKVIDTIRKKGIDAGSGARKVSDILVPRGKGKQTAQILKDAGYTVTNTVFA